MLPTYSPQKAFSSHLSDKSDFTTVSAAFWNGGVLRLAQETAHLKRPDVLCRHHKSQPTTSAGRIRARQWGREPQTQSLPAWVGKPGQIHSKVRPLNSCWWLSETGRWKERKEKESQRKDTWGTAADSLHGGTGSGFPVLPWFQPPTSWASSSGNQPYLKYVHDN